MGTDSTITTERKGHQMAVRSRQASQEVTALFI